MPDHSKGSTGRTACNSGGAEGLWWIDQRKDAQVIMTGQEPFPQECSKCNEKEVNGTGRISAPFPYFEFCHVRWKIPLDRHRVRAHRQGRRLERAVHGHRGDDLEQPRAGRQREVMLRSQRVHLQLLPGGARRLRGRLRLLVRLADEPPRLDGASQVAAGAGAGAERAHGGGP